MRKCTNFWLMPFLIVISPDSVYNRKVRTIAFLSTHLTFNPVYLEQHTMKINQNRTSLDVVLNIAQNFTHDPWVDFSLALKLPKADNYRNLIAYDLNVCIILGKENSVNLQLAQLWLNNFLKYGTLPKQCPIAKGHYFWRGLKIDKVNIPGFLLSGKYRAIVNTYFRRGDATRNSRDSIANLTVYIQAK